ncbi:MAG: hypothetical protein WB780_20030, partial [Candidatus Acidiferrales bacterium]
MRRFFFLAILICSTVIPTLAQSPNTITTIAGGGTNPTTATSAFLAMPRAAVRDAQSNTYISIPGLSIVYKVDTTGNMTPYAGNGIIGFSGDGGPATQAELATPEGLAIDANGVLFIADTLNNRIRRVDTSGNITTVAGSEDPGSPAFGGDGGLATSARLAFPSGVAVDQHENLFIADTNNGLVRRVDGTTQIITTYAGSFTAPAGCPSGPATGAGFAQPVGVAVDTTGNVFISDAALDIVCKVVDATTPTISTYAGTLNNPGAPGAANGDGGPATSAQISAPNGLAVDATGDLLITDSGNPKIRKVDTTQNHIISSIAGTGFICGNAAERACGDGGAAATATFDFPRGVSVDSNGNIIVADTNNMRVRVISSGANPNINALAGGGSGGDGGPATSAVLGVAQILTVDPSENIFALESDGERLREIDTKGDISTFAGLGVGGSTVGTNINGDGGPASNARFVSPFGVTIDSNGNFYIVDRIAAVVRMINANNPHDITTIAGNGMPCGAPGNPNTFPTCGGENVSATSASLSFPSGVAVDLQGRVYISDVNLNTIRVVSGGNIRTFAGTPGQSCNTFPTNCGDGGSPTSALLNAPFGVAVAASVLFVGATDVFIADSGDNVIRKIDGEFGTISTVAFNGNPGFGGDGGPATAAEMNFPEQIAVDSAENLYIGGGNDNLVRRVDQQDQTVITVAGDVNNLGGGFSGDGGPSTQAMISNFGLAVFTTPLGDHDLFIADSGNSRIRKVNLQPVMASIFPASGSTLNFLPTLAGGTQEVVQEVTFQNNGLDDLILTVTSPAPTTAFQLSCFPAGASPCIITVPPKSFGFVQVAFAPPEGVGGTITGTLAFTTNDPANKSFTYNLSGPVASPVELNVSVNQPGNGTISSQPGAILCDSTTNFAQCADPFPTGGPVTLFASPNSGFAFQSWSVGNAPDASKCATDTTGTCSFTMTLSESIGANFVVASPPPPGNFVLTINPIGNGSGTITSTPGGINCTYSGSGSPTGTCSFSFPLTTAIPSVVLTAAPTGTVSGSVFAGWLGGLCGNLPVGPCTVDTFAIAATVAPVFSGPVQPFAKGQVFLGTDSGMIFVYTPTGTLVQVLNSGNIGGNIEGMAFDATGNLYAANPFTQAVAGSSGIVERFGSTGAGPTTFGTGYSTPMSVVVDPSNNVYVGQEISDGDKLLQFSGSTGKQTATFFPAYESDFSGIDWVDLRSDGDTLVYTLGTKTAKTFDVSDNIQLPDLTTTLNGAMALRALPDGTVLVADTFRIVRLDANGNVTQTYTIPGTAAALSSLNLDPDGVTFWTADENTGIVYRLNIATGAVVSQFPTSLGFTSALAITGIGGIAVSGEPEAGTGADLGVSMTAAPNPVNTGSNLTFSITVTNNGPDSAQSATVTEALPAGATFVSSSTTVGTCSGTTTVTCTLGTFANGATADITIVVAPTTAGTLSNTVNVNSSTPDPNPANNSATTSTTVMSAGPAPATIALAAPSDLALGASLTYEIQVGNPGGTAQAVTLTDALPGGLSATSLSSGCAGTTTITCTINSLAAGQTVTLDITVVPMALGSLMNSAAITGGASAGPVTTNVVAGSTTIPLSVEVDSSNPADFVTSSPSSGICTQTQVACTSYFPSGTVVTLTANGPGFLGWSVNNSSTPCPGTGTCTVTLSSAQIVAAAYSSIGIGFSGLTTGVVGIPYGSDLSSGLNGGVPPYTITLTGTLPGGLSFTSPLISGIPTAAGTTPLTVNITDSVGEHGSTPVTLTIINPPTGQEALANGNYGILLHMVSDADGSLFDVVGSLHFNGKGVVDSGTLDTNGNGTGVTPKTASVTGTYTIGSDHRGLLKLQSNGATFAVIAMSVGDVYQGVAHTSHIIEFDDNTGTGLRGTGIARLQDPNAFAATSLAGTYIIGATGQNPTHNRVTEVGVGSVNATGTITSASDDFNDNGTLSTETLISGTYGTDGSNGAISAVGRTQYHVMLNNSVSGTITSDQAVYIVDANTLFSLKIDSGATNTILAATRERQMNPGTFTAASLSGPDVVTKQGPSGGSQSDVFIGVATFTPAAGPNPTTGTIALTKDVNNAGAVTLEGTENDTYTMASTGRFVTVIPGNVNQPIGYLSRPDHGYTMDSVANPRFGTIDLQTGGPFAVPTLATDFFFGGREPASTKQGGDSSGVTSIANGTLSATFDQNHEGGRLDYAFTASFGISVAPTGRFVDTNNHINPTTVVDEIGRVITPFHTVFTEIDPTQNHPTIHESESFMMPPGNPTPNPASAPFTTAVAIGSNATMTLTFTNDSDGLLSFTSVTNATDFSATGGTCITTPPVVVLAHSTCTAIITFAPQPSTATGVTLNEIVTLMTDAGAVTINASGTAAAAPGAALAITISGPANIAVGAKAAYTVVATNNGPAAATGVTVTIVVGDNFTDVSGLTPPAGVTCSRVINIDNGQPTFTCPIGALANAATATITFSDTPQATGSITDTATVTGTNNTNTTTNSTSITTAVGASTQTINVSLLDNGTGGVGTVTDNSVPPQMNCSDATGQVAGPTCMVSYPTGATVTFTATPGAGSIFTGWISQHDPCQAGTAANVCTMTVSTGETLDANFGNGPGTFTLTTALPTNTSASTGAGSIGGGGISCNFSGTSAPTGTCSVATEKSGTVVELIPVQNDNSNFAGYAGSCVTQVGNNCFVVMSKNQTVTPVFTLIPVTVNATVTGVGSMVDNLTPHLINCVNTNPNKPMACSAAYPTGTVLTMTETPGTGFTFTNFTGAFCTSSTATTCTITLNSAAATTVNLGAVFTIGTFELDVSTEGGTGTGTVTSTPNNLSGTIGCGPNNAPVPPGACGLTELFGANITLTAAPTGTTNTFTGWSSSPAITGFTFPCTTNSTTCQFSMPAVPAGANLTVTAAFAKSTGTGPTFTSTALPAGAVGVPYGADIQVSGGTPPYTFSVTPGSGLPTGFNLVATTTGNVNAGHIFNGNPQVGNTQFEMGITVTDSTQQSTSTTISLLIANAPANTQASLLNGQYALMFQSYSELTGAEDAVVGSLTFNGVGGAASVTGVLDMNSATSGVQQEVPVTGTYSVGPDNRGFLTLTAAGQAGNFSAAMAVGNVYRGVASTVSLSQFDDFDAGNNSSSDKIGSGIMKLRDPSAQNTNVFAGTYTFGLSGQTPQGQRAAELGDINFTTSLGVSGNATVNEAGAVVNVSLSGTFTAPDTNGRILQTVTFTPGNTVGKVAIYQVNANEGFAMTVTPRPTDDLLIGSGIRQQNSGFSDSSLVGPDVISLGGSATGGTAAIVGVLTATTTPTPTATITADNNDHGTLTVGQVLTGSYSVNENGVVTFTPVGTASPTTLTIYLAQPDLGFAFTSDSSVSFGRVVPQVGAPFGATSPFTEGFYIGQQEPLPLSHSEFSAVAPLGDAANTVNITDDETHIGGDLLFGQSLGTLNYTVSSTGHIVLNSVTQGAVSGYVSSPFSFDFLDQTSSNPHVGFAAPLTAAPGTPSPAAPTATVPGTVAIGSTGVAPTITITNTGLGPLGFTGFDKTNAPDFTASGTCFTDGVIVVQPGGTCTIIITFAPTATTQTGTLLSEPFIVNTDGTSNVTVNAQGTATSGAGNPPVLGITKSHTGNFTVGQQAATYTVTVSNGDAGPTNGTAVTVTDTIPTGLTLTGMAGTGWACTVATATCTISTILNANASYQPITVTVNVTATSPTQVTNMVTVSGGGSGAANASDPTTIAAAPAPILTISKTHGSDFAIGQQGATYTITVSNTAGAGPTAGGVSVTDFIPEGLALVNLAGMGWTCGNSVPANVCTRADVLAAGSSYPSITVTVNVTATTAT